MLAFVGSTRCTVHIGSSHSQHHHREHRQQPLHTPGNACLPVLNNDPHCLSRYLAVLDPPFMPQEHKVIQTNVPLYRNLMSRLVTTLKAIQVGA